MLTFCVKIKFFLYFPHALTRLILLPSIKKGRKNLKEIIDQLIFYLFYQSYTKRVCFNKWKRSADGGLAFVALLTDLSKVFDRLGRELIIAKLNSYGFSLSSIKLIHDYLSNRKQKTIVNNSYSEWLTMFGLLQRSIL